jgi:hypothetical protein
MVGIFTHSDAEFNDKTAPKMHILQQVKSFFPEGSQIKQVTSDDSYTT